MWIKIPGRSQKTCVLSLLLHPFAFSWLQPVNLLRSLLSLTSEFSFSSYSISTSFAQISKKISMCFLSPLSHNTEHFFFPSLNTYSLAYEKPQTLWPLIIMCGQLFLFPSLEYILLTPNSLNSPSESSFVLRVSTTMDKWRIFWIFIPSPGHIPNTS